MEKKSVCIIGSGRRATALAKIVAENAQVLDEIEDQVNMFVYEEKYEEDQLSTLINTLHINAKYAADITLPKNLEAVTDLVQTTRYADIIIFVMPLSHIQDFCKTILGKIKSTALAISLISDCIPNAAGGLQLASRTISKYLKIPCAPLIGANLGGVLINSFCEATLGCGNIENPNLLKSILSSKNFRINLIDDDVCAEVCGYLKHILGLAAGLMDGFGCSINSRSACVRFGFLEMIRFIDVFYPGSKLSTLIEACGLADLLTVCDASRDRCLGEALAKTGLPLEQVELQVLCGKKAMAPKVARVVSVMMKNKDVEHKFPLFATIHQICQDESKPAEILHCLRKIPSIIFHPTNSTPI